jgi:hypothetical protein
MYVGYTFLPDAVGAHLWFVCTNASASGELAALSLTTLRPVSDTTCIVARGDHPFVQHDSVIYYRAGRLWEVRALQAAIDSGLLVRHECASDKLMQRIREGASVSRFVPRNVRAAIQECSWQPAASAAGRESLTALRDPRTGS